MKTFRVFIHNDFGRLVLNVCSRVNLVLLHFCNMLILVPSAIGFR